MSLGRMAMTAGLALALAMLGGCGEGGRSAQPDPAADEDHTSEVAPGGVPAEEGATDAPAPPPIDDEGERLYRKGLYTEALAHWQKASAKGDAYANYRLGVEYLDGKVVKQNFEKAAAYQKRAAELGDPRGMFELATLYEYGQGVEQSDERAAGYYLMAAERGLAEAQHNVATMYEKGTGLEKDLIQAYKFYALARMQGFFIMGGPAAEGGDQLIPDPLKQLEEVMTPEELDEARRQVGEFRPKK